MNSKLSTTSHAPVINANYRIVDGLGTMKVLDLALLLILLLLILLLVGIISGLIIK